jgi:beta-N-acetylhexosaminidase
VVSHIAGSRASRLVPRRSLLLLATITGQVAAAACARTVSVAPPAAVTRAASTTSWGDSVLAGMSLRDKAAQLVWPMVFGDYTPEGSATWQRIERFIATEHVGGIIMSVGSPLEIAEKLNAMQRLSSVPLLVGADLEFGAGFRARGGYFLPNAIDLGGATIFPPEMGIGATRDSALAYEQGRITAVEGRALGIHVAFAPILDVNNNPANPVIGVRSFGEDPRLAATLGAALVRGIQEHGMVATGKHFPGHGDTDQNSHLTLPTITATRARLDTVELVPFRAAIEAGVGAIMTAHIALPAVLGDSSTPATLSPRVMTDLLRRDLGFRGVLITDAMDMNGVLANVRPGRAGQTVTGEYGTINSIGIAEACKRALEAGADVLLMPSDVPGAIDAVVTGVQEGRFTVARVDSSVRRLLALKSRAGLERQKLVDLDRVRAVVGDTSNLAIARLAAERSITLAKDSLQIVPLFRGRAAGAAGGGARPRVLVITLAPRADLGAGVTFTTELRRGLGEGVSVRTIYVNSEDPAASTPRVIAAADSAELTIVGSYVSTSYSAATAAAAPPIVDLLRGVQRRNPRTILVNFGNPYLYQQVPEVSAYLLAWGGFPVSQRAAALALVGAIPITGKLPISIPPYLPFGAGMARAASSASSIGSGRPQ